MPTNNGAGYNQGGYGMPMIPAEYKPISMWGYLGFNILFALPFIGFICILILSFAPQNVNLKNYARSFLLVYIIVTVISIIAAIIIMALGGAAVLPAFLDSMRYY
ncbi:MAG: hypothetical protein IJU50_07830 [Lachnospiraceae bacterium]|nr:hypothetical protein [Lachnospiraceae bacterium]